MDESSSLKVFLIYRRILYSLVVTLAVSDRRLTSSIEEDSSSWQVVHHLFLYSLVATLLVSGRRLSNASSFSCWEALLVRHLFF